MSKKLSDLPYGMAFCTDGSAFLYNRRYEPMYIKSLEGVVTPADRTAWKKAVSQIWFYDDGTKPSIVKHMSFVLESFIKSGKEVVALTHGKRSEPLEVGALS